MQDTKKLTFFCVNLHVSNITFTYHYTES